MNRLVLAFLVTSLSPVALADGSPWLPADGSTTLSLDVISGSTDEFFIGDDSVNLGGDLEATYIWLNASYGYDDIWAFDFRTGYAESSLETNLTDQDDISDTSFGVTYQIINEFEADNGWPTISVRGGYTIGGDYETNILEAIGDGASGLDLSLLVGKSLNDSVALLGDLTFRQRDNDVAEAIKYLASVIYTTPVQGLGLQAAYAGIRTDSDINFGDGEVTVDQFPQTDRDSDWLILGANYGFENGIGLVFSYSSLLSGKNIADSDIGSLSLSYSF